MMIRLISGNEVKEIEYTKEKSMMEALRDADVYVPAYCNGRGVCGKCGIRLVSGKLAITPEDAAVFDEEHLAKGWRLSCKAYADTDVEISLLSDDEDDFEVLSSHGARNSGTVAGLSFTSGNASAGSNGSVNGNVSAGGNASANLQKYEASAYGIAVDIGTTTISMDLMNLDNGQVAGSDNRINRQRAFGADVISRIQASNSGQKEGLRQSIVHDLVEGFEKILKTTAINAEKITKIIISANTTMGHLLLGYSCETLGVYPFTPVNIGTIKKSFAEVFDCDLLDAQVILVPGISTYVGADIASGLLCCGFGNEEKVSMLIDLGTNGEMAIGNKDRLLCTSTAAGPAFEGGNISCGNGSVKGAVCAVEIKNADPLEIAYTTIGDGEPVGICGTGVMDITAELVKEGLVDETGLLDDDYFDDGIFITRDKNGEDIVFTQHDVREIQLAKAAVRAGIEVLVKKYGIRQNDVDTVYLAGGFGFRLNIEKAVSIGLLPEGFADKIKIAGNTSLKGATLCLMDEDKIKEIEKIVEHCAEVSLGSDKDFNSAYMESIYFE